MAEGFNISSYVYEKRFHCPVCDATFSAPVARHGKSRITSTDTDLKQNYSPFDPLPYDIVICSACGYAESVVSFEKSMPETIVDRLLHEIKPKHWGHTYPLELTKDMAVERFNIAIDCNEVKKGKLGVRAYMYLRIAWLYRNYEDKSGELQYLKKSLESFKTAFQSEKPPIAGMDENAVSYLVGELERRLGNDDEALRWFSKVVSSRGAESRIKDRAIDQKELILSARRTAVEHAKESPAQEVKSKKKFLWF